MLTGSELRGSFQRIVEIRYVQDNSVARFFGAETGAALDARFAQRASQAEHPGKSANILLLRFGKFCERFALVFGFPSSVVADRPSDKFPYIPSPARRHCYSHQEFPRGLLR